MIEQELMDDVKYKLKDLIEDYEPTKQNYGAFKNQIRRNRCFIVKNEDGFEAKIYNAELTVILNADKLPVINLDTEEETTIQGWQFAKSFIEGFKEGEEYLENEIKAFPNFKYKPKKEWSDKKKSHPIIINHKVIKEFGYYSGIVSKVEELNDEYPEIFFKETFNDSESKDSENDLSQNKNTEKNALLDLKSQFIDKDKYDKVILRLIENKTIKKDLKGNLILTPLSRKNALYEAVTIYDVLKHLGLLNKTVRSPYEIGNILSNTFLGWKLSTRIIGDTKTFKKFDDYKLILNDI